MQVGTQTQLSKGFKPTGTHKKKTQIVLGHTSREAEEYLTSLQFRYNGQYDKIPHYLIKKDGEVLNLLDESKYSNIFNKEFLNKNGIFIMLENLGWLERKPLTQSYINWKGTIYNGEVYEKKWRDYFFWDLYPEQQIDSLVKLIDEMTIRLNIKRRCTGHNTKIDGINDFEGVVSRSNFDTRFTDLSPAFNFIEFVKKIENNEQELL